MRLTAFTDYSLRVLIYAAAAPERRITIAEIAKAFAISEHHLVKVVHQLGRIGVLANTRGRQGGLKLARPASEINVGAVVRATEGDDVPAECFDPDRNACPIAGICRLEKVFSQALQAFHATLDRYTIADLATNREALKKVLWR